jgi:hypothetical protein
VRNSLDAPAHITLRDDVWHPAKHAQVRFVDMTRLLDNDDVYVIRRTSDAAAELIQLWHAQCDALPPSQSAAGALFVHGSNCWQCICKLLHNCQSVHEIEALSNGAAAILRSLHDAGIQLEYILMGDRESGKTSDDLGRLYWDYEIVERHRAVSRVDNFGSVLAKRLATSPKRSAAEPHLQMEYERVKSNYPTKLHWYRGGLAQLAASIGREEEHFWLLSLYNSSVHGGPTAVRHGPFPSGADLYIIAMNILARAGRMLMSAMGVTLSEAASEIFESESDILNLPNEEAPS